jgi:iron complex transport system ATP-binding protein
MTTHDPGHAFLCASRVALMSRGRIIALDAPAAALTGPALQDAYGISLQVVESPEHPGMKMVLPKLL